jgi:hypothetical protein
MATQYIHAQVILQNVDGLAVDEVENTFSFLKDPGDPFTSVTALLNGFYNALAPGASKPLGEYLSISLDRVNPPQVKYYDVTAHLSGLPAGPPVAVAALAPLVAASGAYQYPNQCCATLSFYDSLSVSGETTRSHRGRIYFGPLDGPAVFTPAKGPQLDPAFLTDATEACKAMADAGPTSLYPCNWMVWSRKLAAMNSVIGGFVYDQIDTQRRRRMSSTAKTSWVA